MFLLYNNNFYGEGGIIVKELVTKLIDVISFKEYRLKIKNNQRKKQQK